MNAVALAALAATLIALTAALRGTHHTPARHALRGAHPHGIRIKTWRSPVSYSWTTTYRGEQHQAPVVDPCRCGHAAEAHEHYRPGTDCAHCRCRRLRRPLVARVRARLAGASA